MENWKTICYVGTGDLYGENGQYDDLNLKIAIERGTMIVKWLSTRRELAEKAITFRSNTEANCSGFYIVRIEVRDDWWFETAGLTVNQLRELVDGNNQKEIFGS